MTDVLTRKQRSYNMSRIKGKNTEPEMILRLELAGRGIRGYRIHYRLPGKPDIVFTRKKIAVFIDGCFWHRCSECFIKPSTRSVFWEKKINGNVERDILNNKKLIDSGWKILRIWEHQIRKNPEKIVSRIIKHLK